MKETLKYEFVAEKKCIKSANLPRKFFDVENKKLLEWYKAL